MPTNTYSPIKSRVARLTRLSTCGVPVIGTRSKLVTKGFIKVENKTKIESGTEFKQKNADGEWCVNEADESLLDRYEPAIDFCKVDPDAVELLTAARLLVATADEGYATLGSSIGFAAANRAAANFALELWTKLAGGACGEGGDPLWVYSLWPWIYDGFVGDQTYENGVVTMPITNAKTKGAAAEWDNGPHDDMTVVVQAGEHFVQYVTDVQPPAETVGAVALVAEVP